MKVAELREICELTLSLTQLRQNECKHLDVGNFASKVFAQLLHNYEHRFEKPVFFGVDMSKEQDKCDAAVFYWGDNPFPGDSKPGPVPPAVPKHIDQVAAKILELSEYAWAFHVGVGKEWSITKPDLFKTTVPVQFDSDTLEGRQQLDALENYLHQHEEYLVKEAKMTAPLLAPYDGRKKRLSRIKWMLREIAKR